jgi:tetratricopeptide (TPR) repeat protein
MADARAINLVFGSTVAVLAGCVLGFLYYSGSRKPVIAPPSAAALPADHPALPENHPPIESARELMTLEQLSRSDPQNPDYKIRIGNLYYDMGQYRRAAEAYQASLTLRPEDPSVETDLATCLHQLGEHDKALATLEHVLRYRPNFRQALLNKGVVLYAGKNDRRGAIAAWEELLRVDPNLPQRAELQARIDELKAAGQ